LIIVLHTVRGMLSAVSVSALFFGALMWSSAQAFVIGQADVRSFLGEPLNMQIPVHLDVDESLTTNCIRGLNRDASYGTPVVTGVTVELIATGRNKINIQIRTRQPVNEPAAKLVLQIGCESPLVREFVFLLDPPLENWNANFLTENKYTDELSEKSSVTAQFPDNTAKSNAPDNSLPKENHTSDVQQKKQQKVGESPPKNRSANKGLSPKLKAPVAAQKGRVTLSQSEGDLTYSGLRLSIFLADRTNTDGQKVSPTLTELEKAEFAQLRAQMMGLGAAQSILHQQKLLGAQINELQTKTKEETVARQETVTNSVDTGWLYLVSAIALLFAITATVLYRRNKEPNTTIEEEKACWQPMHFADNIEAKITASGLKNGDTDFMIPVPVDTDLWRKKNGDADLLKRQQESLIEVMELSDTEAFEMFQKKRGADEKVGNSNL
jgi:hypothetical protein